MSVEMRIPEHPGAGRLIALSLRDVEIGNTTPDTPETLSPIGMAVKTDYSAQAAAQSLASRITHPLRQKIRQHF